MGRLKFPASERFTYSASEVEKYLEVNSEEHTALKIHLININSHWFLFWN